MAFVFDINELDLGELEDLADAAGIDPLALNENWQPDLKAVRAFVWLLKRREDPGFTLDDARRVKLHELAALVPPAAGGSAGSAPSPSSATSSA